jgi:hypothetical protein
MKRTCDLSAASDLQGVGRLPDLGLGAPTGLYPTSVQPDCQTLGALLESQQALEDHHVAALAFHWRRWCELRATRRRLENLIFAGGVR